MAIPYKKQFVKSDGRKLTRSGPRDMQARALSGGGGTDPQLIELLTNQISDLKAEVLAFKSQSGQAVPAGFFSPEQVDAEINKAVAAAVAEAAVSFKGNKNSDLAPIVKEYKSQILTLQKANDDLTRLHATIAKENSDLKNQLDKLKTEQAEVNELQKQIAVLGEQLKGKDDLIDTLKSRPAIMGDGVAEIEDPNRPQMEQVFVDPLEEDAGEGMKSTINVETLTKEDQVDSKVDKLRGLLGKKLPNI